MNLPELKILFCWMLFADVCSRTVKIETFTVKSSEEEEKLLKDDVIGPPLSEYEFEESDKIKENPQSLPASDEGDIDPILIAGMFEGDIRGINDTDGRNGILHSWRKWPKGIIPYVISNHYNSAQRLSIARAMKFYHKHTCVKFVRRSNHRNYIHIFRGGGCSSDVGRRGGVQYVSLGYRCLGSGTIQHELMHAVGFWHEQSRYDRDNYVSIYWKNIVDHLKFNFQKFSLSTTQTFGQPYDYKSVMHYGPYAFSKYRGYRTIVPKQRGVSIGQRSQLSLIDIKKINALYKCSKSRNKKSKKTSVSKKKSSKGRRTTKTPGIKNRGKFVDRAQHCSYWASAGYCKSYHSYMKSNCQKSCSKCQDCKDNNRYCASWAKSNQCRKNPKYMLVNCKKSCGTCSC